MYEGAHKLDIYERLSRSRYFVGARWSVPGREFRCAAKYRGEIRL